MAITNDSSNVFALQKLYIAMGGSSADIQNMQTENAMIEKIRALLSSGGGSGGPAYEIIAPILLPHEYFQIISAATQSLETGEVDEVHSFIRTSCSDLLDNVVDIVTRGKIPCLGAFAVAVDTGEMTSTVGRQVTFNLEFCEYRDPGVDPKMIFDNFMITFMDNFIVVNAYRSIPGEMMM